MSSRLTQDDVRALAFEILRADPDASVRIRLLRDVLRVAPGDERLRTARHALEDSPHFERLRREQRADGSWGRLHSRDTASAQSVPTTEWAVDRALALGVAAGDPMLQKASAYLASVLRGEIVLSDPPERNDRWATGVRLFAAATLARIDPRHPAVDPVWHLWHEIARRAFASGRYDPADEAAAHLDLTGASVRASYLVLSNRYALTLLSSRASDLADGVAAALVRWIWSRPDGVGPYGVPLSPPTDPADAGFLERWFLSHEMVAAFAVPGVATAPVADWLGGRRCDGLWDLGARASWAWSLPLSESWRRRDARANDWSVRVLSLLATWRARGG
jgi:hypothetical protein